MISGENSSLKEMLSLQNHLLYSIKRTLKSPRELARQSEAKRMHRLKARQMCIDTNAISKNPLLLIAQDTQ